MIASLDTALAEYTAGIDRAVRFVTIDQVDVLAEFYLHNRRTPAPAQIRAEALREAAALMDVAATNCRAAFTYPPRTKEERDYQTGALIHTYARNAILALIDAPLSPTAVDVSPAPDAGGKP